MTVRPATEADEAVLRELWSEFELEVPEPDGFVPETWEEEWADTRRQIGAGNVFLADDGEGVTGVAKAEAQDHGAFHIHLVYVRPRARRSGVANALLRECVGRARAAGAAMISLHVLVDNEPARTVWRRLGFRDVSTLMASPLDVLEERLSPRGEGEHRATTHVQTDDEQSVERAIAQFIPRLQSPDVRSAESWIRVADPLLDRDREAHGRFAREVSERLGRCDRRPCARGRGRPVSSLRAGRMVDEYLSVPNYYEALPKGDELALAANPTLVSRLTGATADEVRESRARLRACTSCLLPRSCTCRSRG